MMQFTFGGAPGSGAAPFNVLVPANELAKIGSLFRLSILAIMSPTAGKYILGANRGPLLTDESPQGLEKVESAGGLSLHKTPTRTEKLRRHWKRFWLFYCIGNVIFLAIFLPVFFLVVIPAIAQLVVNKSDIVLVNAIVNDPQPNSTLLTLQTKVDLKLALPARIEPVTFHLFQRDYGVDDAYADIDIPGQVIKGNHSLGIDNVRTPILNQTAWKEFVRQVVFQEETSLAMQGVTNAYLGVLKSHVHLNKDVVTPALNQFDGFSISDATLILPPEEDGTNLIGNATLPNPTVLHLQVGTLVLDVKSGGTTIGNVTLNDVTLVPGNNTFPLTGVLDIKSIFSNFGDILKAQAGALKNGTLAIDSVTRSVTWNGTLVPYYTDILSTLTLSTTIPLGDTIKNTLRHLLDGKNLTSALSGLIDGANSSSLSSRDVHDRGPVDLAPFLKGNRHVQDFFRGVDDDQRDSFIDSLAAAYPNL
ncbi:hypothetical protein N7532_002366 [Penicillium argentinense]|uniref:Uncharacterized protein n=1 Tax=Penicillium argentinense TaxID=1131581 RepID=A0A9W9G075_9EURO|nr:uncharacterized protein N7532_002366 [Penicillium argentinense]KAJ5109721.1 hypothetical protein N7532_002366 [Penicillium argentinense]